MDPSSIKTTIGYFTKAAVIGSDALGPTDGSGVDPRKVSALLAVNGLSGDGGYHHFSTLLEAERFMVQQQGEYLVAIAGLFGTAVACSARGGRAEYVEPATGSPSRPLFTGECYVWRVDSAGGQSTQSTAG